MIGNDAAEPLSNNNENQAAEDRFEQEIPETTERALIDWIDALNHQK